MNAIVTDDVKDINTRFKIGRAYAWRVRVSPFVNAQPLHGQDSQYSIFA